jgi:hypothetical protein
MGSVFSLMIGVLIGYFLVMYMLYQMRDPKKESLLGVSKRLPQPIAFTTSVYLGGFVFALLIDSLRIVLWSMSRRCWVDVGFLTWVAGSVANSSRNRSRRVRHVLERRRLISLVLPLGRASYSLLIDILLCKVV